MKKVTAILMALCLSAALFAGCSSQAPAAGNEELSGEITVVTREEGSGTRSAFVELFGIEQKDEQGNKVDMTTLGANVTNSTAVMMTPVAGDLSAIGYISLGSLNDTVKPLRILSALS